MAVTSGEKVSLTSLSAGSPVPVAHSGTDSGDVFYLILERKARSFFGRELAGPVAFSSVARSFSGQGQYRQVQDNESC